MGLGQPILLLLRASRHQNFDVNSPDFKLLLQISEKHHMGQIKQRPLLTTCVFRDMEVAVSCVLLHGLPAVPGHGPGTRSGCELRLRCQWAAESPTLPYPWPWAEGREGTSSVPVTLAASLSETARAKPLPATVRLQHPPWWAEEAGCPAVAKESLRGARGQGASPAWLLHMAERGPPAQSPAVLPLLLTCCTSPPHFPEP